MQCPICNAQVPDGIPYCPDCGSPLGSAPQTAAPVNNTPVQPTAPVDNTPAQPEVPEVEDATTLLSSMDNIPAQPVNNQPSQPSFVNSQPTQPNSQPGFGAPVPPVNQGAPNQQPMGYGAPMGGMPQNPYQFNQPGNQAAPAPAKKGSKLPIIIVIALVVIALIVGVVLILRDKDDKDKKEPTTTEATTTEATTTEATTTEATTTEATTEATTTEATTEAPVDDSEAVREGDYRFTGATVEGVYYTREELELAGGQTYDMTLTINGSICVVDGSAMGYNIGSCSFTQDGEDITLKDLTGEIYGTYDADELKLTIDADGVLLEFVHEDIADNPVLSGDLNDATATLHGTYELASTASGGQSFTVEEMEEISGETYAMTLTINSGFCLVDASEMGAGQGMATIYVDDNNNVTLDDGAEVLYGTYDPVADTITISMDGIDMVFEKSEE